MSTTIESTLTREFDIRFIDARNIVNEAKINLGIVGYHNKSEERKVFEESCRIFHTRTNQEKDTMRRLSANLVAIKDFPSGSFSLSSSSSSSSFHPLGASSDNNSSSTVHEDDDISLVFSSFPKRSSFHRNIFSKGGQKGSRLIASSSHR